MVVITPPDWTRPAEAVRGANYTMTAVLRRVLALYAPILPFVTDELYAALYSANEGAASIHLTAWPETRDNVEGVDEVRPVLAVLHAVRSIRTERRLGQSQEVDKLIINCAETVEPLVRSLEASLLGASRARELASGQAERPTEYEGLWVDIVALPDT